MFCLGKSPRIDIIDNMCREHGRKVIFCIKGESGERFPLILNLFSFSNIGDSQQERISSRTGKEEWFPTYMKYHTHICMHVYMLLTFAFIRKSCTFRHKVPQVGNVTHKLQCYC